VDRVVVAGLDVTREKVVRRELQVTPGQPLRAGALVESQRRLATLSTFSGAALSEISDGGERSTVLVSLEEGPRTTFGYGLGYSERELLRGSVEVTRRNLFGLDRSLSLYARGSFRGNRFLATYREPWFLGQKREVFLTAFHEEENRDTFDFRRNGGLLQTGRSLGGKVNLILRWLYQQTDVYKLEVPIDEIDREFRDYAVSGPSASILRDTRDDPLEPTRGTFLGADGQLSLAPLGGASYVKGFLQATMLERLAPRTLFVASARIGLARTFGPEQPLLIPLPERFFAGGDYGPRGFRTDGVGPVLLASNDTVTPTGGNALILGGAELRFDASRFLSLAAFTDTGNVYPLVAEISLGGLRWSAGLGVRYKTALGPIRVDWGYKLNRRSGESPSRFHFTIGHAF
jgi:outer membrane protein assembly factor BamA